MFNNREIATALWMVVLLAWVLRQADVRESLMECLRSLLEPKILVPLCLMTAYVAGLCLILANVSLWNLSLLKDTIVWFVATAVTITMRSITSGDAENVMRKALAESFAIVVVIEFLINTYTFSLPAELAIVPVLTLIVCCQTVASYRSNMARVARFLKQLQVIIGFAVLTMVVARALPNLKALQSMDTVRSIALAPLLFVLLTPYLYAFLLLSDYEQVFMRLGLGTENSEVRRYARRRILMHAGLSLRKVHGLLRYHALDLMEIQTESDVDLLVEQTMDDHSYTAAG